MQNNYHLIRFIAASLVLFGHCYPLTGRGNNDYLTVASHGIFPTSHMGVCIFFIVSGFLVSQSLQHSKTVVDFVWKRIIRIFPALIISLLFCVFIIGPLCTSLPISQSANQPISQSANQLSIIISNPLKLTVFSKS